MAKTKADLQLEWEMHHSLLSQAKSAVAASKFDEALDIAVESWEFLDGMMAFSRKYEDVEFSAVEAIEIVLAYAPLRFRFDSLTRLETLLKQQRGIQRKSSTDLSKAIAVAHARMQDAHLLWTLLEIGIEACTAEMRGRLGSDKRRWVAMLRDWQCMGLVNPSPDSGMYGYSLATRMSEVVRAKCSGCGARVKAPKSKLLEPINCPKCKALAFFVILTEGAVSP